MELISLLTSVVSNNLKELFESITKDFGNEIKHIISNNILEYQVEEYNRNYYAKTILHRVQPKKLLDFYQPLFISPCDKIKRQISQKANNKRISTHSIGELFLEKQFVTIIGTAGSGKSTLVKYLFINAIDSNYKIPLKIELRYLNDYSGSLIEYIKEKIFKLEKIALNDKIIERLLISGDFVVFLDGYDEINSSKREKITKDIDDLVKIYNQNNYLLTSRPYTEIDLIPLFHNYEVCDLSDTDIIAFIKKQIPTEERELCDKIIEAINNPENRSYKSFLSNPLLLSMFILTFQSYSNIPQRRSDFYSQVFDTLFSVHDSMSKLAYVREKQSGLSKEQIIEVLKLFSFISYFDEKFVFNGLYLQQKLSIIKEKKKNIQFVNDSLIDDLQVAIGILNKEGIDYTFPHRSLQEYFAAVYISTLNDSNKSVVYNKIIDSFIKTKRLSISSRDNFYLLLSELDKKSVISLAIIPFLRTYIDNLNIDGINYRMVIEKFVTLRSIYDSFLPIIGCSDLATIDIELNKRFHSYKIERKDIKPGSKEWDIINEGVREKLAEQDIKPFLKSFLPSIEAKIKELNDYLVAESTSDSEIIDLI